MKLNAPRRALMATLAAAAMPRPAAAQLPPARTVSLFTWSRAVEQVREHAAAFSRATTISAYPFASDTIGATTTCQPMPADMMPFS